MTPGRGPLEFSFSCERDNSVGSDPRKNSWPANLPYGLERRTMGLELEDTASSNALASLRENLDGDGLEDMDMDSPSDAMDVRANSADHKLASRAASGTSVLGVDGLMDVSKDWKVDEEGPRPYSQYLRAVFLAFSRRSAKQSRSDLQPFPIPLLLRFSASLTASTPTSTRSVARNDANAVHRLCHTDANPTRSTGSR